MSFQWYTPKPVEVLAKQVTEENVVKIIKWLNDNYGDADHLWYLGAQKMIILDTGWERPIYARPGNWIVLPDVDNDAEPVVWSDMKMTTTYDKVRG